VTIELSQDDAIFLIILLANFRARLIETERIDKITTALSFMQPDHPDMMVDGHNVSSWN
jgi:hypothetical protein